MDKRILKKTGQEVSLLGFGAMRLPRRCEDKADIDVLKAEELIDFAHTHGVNYYDTAYTYHDGTSESFLGSVLSKYPRDSHYIASKLPWWLLSEESDPERIFDEQLKRLKIDYFDFYLLHNTLKSLDKYSDKYDIYRFLEKKREEGLIKNLGFSHHDTPEYLDEVCQKLDWDFAQLQLNYVDWTMQRGKEQYEVLLKYKLQCIVMEPARGGALCDLGSEANGILNATAPGKSIASFTFRYNASLPNVLCILSGMNRMDHLMDNIETLTNFTPLTQREQDAIEKASGIFLKNVLIPCTGCRYCMDCPSGVNIPGVFEVYNNYLLGKNRIIFNRRYGGLHRPAQAHNCVMCKKCMEHCPQKIDIVGFMETIAALAAS